MKILIIVLLNKFFCISFCVVFILFCSIVPLSCNSNICEVSLWRSRKILDKPVRKKKKSEKGTVSSLSIIC